MTEPSSISAQRLSKLFTEKNVEIIDVRSPSEFREVHLDNAINIPLDALDPQALMEAGKNRDKRKLYFICQSGSRGAAACKKMLDAGYSEVWNVEGGTKACVAAGLPVIRGKAAMSIERQTRIAAGSLVLAGIFLGMLINPFFVALSAFVGAGLVFAGVTDTCGMSIFLSKMPWNKKKTNKN